MGVDGRSAEGKRVAERLRASFRGELVDPDDRSYDEARTLWNSMIDRRPALIARCRTTADAAAAVRAAREEDLELAVRGGGHSVAGHSVCDGGVVVDLTAMRRVDVHADERRATVEGGALLRDLDGAAQQAGLAMPAGVVSHTGVGGLTLGGGIGWLSRLYGLSCDSLLGAEVVTADGDVVVASETDDAELLWALRGGGGNFGVVTRFELGLHPLEGTVWTTTLAYAPDDGHAALAALAEVAAGAPRELTLVARIGAARALPFVDGEQEGRPLLAVVAVHVGGAAQGERLVAPLRAAGPLAELGGETTYVDLQRSADESGAAGLRRYWKAYFVSSLGEDGLATFLEQGLRAVEESPHAGCELFSLGGAIGDTTPGDSAFAHRGAEWDLLATSGWSDPADDERETAIARRAAEAMAPYSHGVYANDLGDEGADRVRAAYGEANYERLVRVKDRLDPGNVFHRNQNIQPSGDPSA
jgi:FAD/FMN-containing dehydrogenase